MCKLSQLETIGVKFCTLLLNAGIENQKQLLEFCCNESGRRNLAKKTGINPKLILKWAIQADLARIQGMKEEHSELLALSYVNSVQVLASYNPAKLYLNLQFLNEKMKLVEQMPNFTLIESWIKLATKLLPKLEY